MYIKRIDNIYTRILHLIFEAIALYFKTRKEKKKEKRLAKHKEQNGKKEESRRRAKETFETETLERWGHTRVRREFDGGSEKEIRSSRDDERNE